MSDKTKNGENLVFAYVDGAAADTDIAVVDPADSQGITTGDELKMVLEFPATPAVPNDRTSTSSITSNGNIQCTVATDTDKLLVIYRRNN